MTAVTDVYSIHSIMALPCALSAPSKSTARLAPIVDRSSDWLRDPAGFCRACAGHFEKCQLIGMCQCTGTWGACQATGTPDPTRVRPRILAVAEFARIQTTGKRLNSGESSYAGSCQE